MKKTMKKSVSMLLAVILVFSLFTIVPITASAETYDSGFVFADQLQEGDIITANIDYLRPSGCTFVLKGGRYGEGFIGTLFSTCPNDSDELFDVNFEFEDGYITIDNSDPFRDYVPVDQEGRIASALIVLAKDGNKLTIGGYSETYDPTTPIEAYGITFTYPWTSNNSLPNNSGTYYLTKDVKLTSEQTVGYNKNIQLYLNGHTISVDDSLDHWCSFSLTNGRTTYEIYGNGKNEKQIIGDTSDKTFIYITNGTKLKLNYLTLFGFDNGVVLNGGMPEATINNCKITNSKNGIVASNGSTTILNDSDVVGCSEYDITTNAGNGPQYFHVNGTNNVGTFSIMNGNIIEFEEGASFTGKTTVSMQNPVSEGESIVFTRNGSGSRFVTTSTDYSLCKNSSGEWEAVYGYVPPTYIVTWKNWNNDELYVDQDVPHGETPTYPLEDPTRPDDLFYTYTFSGWNPEVTAVTDDTTYTATYDANPKPPAPDPPYDPSYTYRLTFIGPSNTTESIDTKLPCTLPYEDWLRKSWLWPFDPVPDATVADGDEEYLSLENSNLTVLKPFGGFKTINNVTNYHHTVRVICELIDAPAPTYTVTWKNWDGTVLETDENVAEGATPSYDGTPERPEDANNTYTFSGWSDGSNTYAADALPAVSGDVTYTAQFTAKPKTLIAGHSLSLDGNIGINFYLDPSVAGLTAQQVNGDNLSYTFAWADVETTKAKVNVAEQANQKNFRVSEDGKYIIITCHVCAAEMTCDVIASFTLGDKTESETYSVRKYCDDSVLSENAQYKDDTKLVELVEAMLNYGAMAQTKFGINTGTPDSSDTPGTSGKLANEGVTYNPGDVTTAMLEKAIADANPNETADNMNNVAAALGAKWFSTSLIYLDDSTLRHYFVKATDAFNPSDYTGNKSNYYYYVEKTGIPAAELDNLQTFMESNTEKTFKYSPLDFVKGMIEYSADEDSVNLAKSLYWYNQAANKYFA